MKATIRKIADLCGVSTMTVSRVFNPENADMVKESTRKKILAAAKQYGYHPVIIGKSFSSGKTYKVGLILDAMTADLSSPTFSRFMEAVCAELQSRNYSLVLLQAKDVRKHEGANVRELLESKVADGYILGKTIVFESFQDTLRKTPVVVLSSREDELPESSEHVQISRPVASGFRAMWQLIPKKWRRSVAVVAQDEKYFYPRKSRASLLTAAAPEDAELKIFYCTRRPGFFTDRANAAAVAEEHFEELRKFKVIWGINDFHALGVADVFYRHGLIPGKDYYLMGFDNLEPLIPGVEPVLTTCDQHWDEIGRLAADTILQLISGKNVPGNLLTVEPEIIRRTSL